MNKTRWENLRELLKKNNEYIALYSIDKTKKEVNSVNKQVSKM